MNKPRITQTTHVLPFNNLESFQFERLCYWLLDHNGEYTDIEYFGGTSETVVKRSLVTVCEGSGITAGSRNR